jgi:pilus assembly protein TadC
MEALNILISCVTGSFSGFCIFPELVSRFSRKKAVRNLVSANENKKLFLSSGFNNQILCELLLLCKNKPKDMPAFVVSIVAFDYEKLAKCKIVDRCFSGFTPLVLCTLRMRISFICAVVLFVFGYIFSFELAIFSFVLGFAFGFAIVKRALNNEQLLRQQSIERELARLIDVVCLGIKSGLSIDKSIVLYEKHFNTFLASELRFVTDLWKIGLYTTQDSLLMLRSFYDSRMLSLCVQGINRALSQGTSITSDLQMLSTQIRSEYKSSVEEKIEKVPVKMMVPTGLLILPAMLILVMGPVLIQLLG